MVALPFQPLDALPRYATSFVGRHGDQADLVQLLLDPEIRVVTLIGPGGVGKTRLAVETVRRHRTQLAERFPDGVLFVDMSPIVDSGRALSAFAAALELPEAADPDLPELVSEALANRELLVILDNLEQVLEGGARLAAIAASCSGIKVLATSRTPLRVSGEQRYTVPLLATSSTAHQDATSGDAMILYEARAREVVPGFSLNEQTRPIVRRICQKLDGLPLAIELAVPRLRMISTEALLARLENRLQVLDRGPVDGVRRHHTLDATIDWSTQFLSPDLLRVFLRLAILPETFGLDAIETIGGGARPFEDIAGLVDQALVQPVIDGPSVEPRFRMLSTVREYASRRLAEGEDLAAAQNALVSFCVELIERADPLMIGPEAAIWVAKIAAEYETIRVALDLTLSNPGRDEPIRILASLWRFTVLKGGLTEARIWIDRARSCRARSESLLWARFSFSAGILAEMQHDYADALTQISEARAIAESIGDSQLQAKCWLELGHIAGDTGSFERALDCYEHSAELAKVADNLRTEVIARCGLANVENRRGHDEAAARHYSVVIPLVRKMHDDLTWATLLSNYGVVLARQGKFPEAKAAQEESLSINKRLGNQVGVAMALVNLNEVNPGSGLYLPEALAIARAVDMAELTLSVLVNLAEEAIATEQRKKAADYLTEALALAQESQMPVVISETLDHAAQLIADDDPGRAARLVSASTAIRQQHDIHWTGSRGKAQADLVKSLRSRLGSATYESESAAGASRSIDETVIEANAALALLTLGVEPIRNQVPEVQSVLLDLTRREMEVLRLISLGSSDREIGNALFISPKTANHHVTRILSKLGCSSRAAAAAIAVRNGIS